MNCKVWAANKPLLLSMFGYSVKKKSRIVLLIKQAKYAGLAAVFQYTFVSWEVENIQFWFHAEHMFRQ